MEQAEDFRAESLTLHSLLKDLPGDCYGAPTQFKDWTIDDILQHLHFWNGMAALQVTDPDTLRERIKNALSDKRGMRAFERDFLGNPSGTDLLRIWSDEAERVADIYADIDPKKRLCWAGPDMSARSSMTARLMETWAHGQAIYDQLGVSRQNQDRIRNIVILGLNTYDWSFSNRGEVPPAPVPTLRLTAPSGAAWVFGGGDGDGNEEELIEGPAEAFCQVVTQCRNVADTALTVTGANAAAWMAQAQCFAGPPMEPPPPGRRHIR